MNEPKKFKILGCKYNDKTFKIEEDLPDVGWYLKVFNDEANCIADHLQENLEILIDFAFEKYQIPKDLWTEKIDIND